MNQQKKKFKMNKFNKKFIFKGRKVFRDIPFFKKKKEEVKININNKNDIYDYFNYSNDEEDYNKNLDEQ